MILIPHFDIGHKRNWYAVPSATAWVQTVSISRILPTQSSLSPETLAYYEQRTRMVDRQGQLPFGVRFAGSPVIYLIDGHHRWYASLKRGRSRFRLLVDDYPVCFSRAMLGAATHKRQRPRPPAMPAAYYQMRFVWH